MSEHLDDDQLTELLHILDSLDTDNLSALLTAARLNPKTDLSGTDLSGANLSKQDFREANLRDSNLTGANLDEADLSYADLTNADLSGASLVRTDLRFASFVNVNVTGAKLHGCKLRDADVTGTNFSTADTIRINLKKAALLSEQGPVLHAAARIANKLHKPYCTVGAIGEVQHGKTTLLAGITKVLSGRNDKTQFRSFESLENAYREIQAGLSITTTAYAAAVNYETQARIYRHLDFRGHADYVKSAITGMAQLDGLILVVAANDGPTSQTREHVLLARQVGVPYIVVALNKADIVDSEHLDLTELEVRELLKRYKFPGDEVPVIRVSALGALNGDAKWERKIDELMEALDAYIPLPIRDVEKPFLMPIEDIFSISGRGTVVMGRIERGKVKLGEEVEIVGFRNTRKTVVTGVEMFKKQLDEGMAGDNAGLLLRGIGKDDVERGMVLAKPGSITPHTKFKAEVYILSKEEGGRHVPFFKGYRPQFYFRTTDVTGVAELPSGMELVMPGDNVSLTIELITPVAMEKGLRFAIREGGRTVGAGTVNEILV